MSAEEEEEEEEKRRDDDDAMDPRAARNDNNEDDISGVLVETTKPVVGRAAKTASRATLRAAATADLMVKQRRKCARCMALEPSAD